MWNNEISPKYWRELRDHEQKRFEDLVILFEKAMQKKYNWSFINEKSNETLMDIACSTGRYNSLLWYYQSKYQERRKQEIENEERELNQDEKQALNLCEKVEWLSNEPFNEPIGFTDNVLKHRVDQIHKDTLDLMLSRNEKYGDSWKVLTIPSLANLCEMKLHRIARLWDVDAKTEDELMDVINYCVFGLMKYKESQKTTSV